jgi:MoaA/NifB/PqqE/SkfB family radical SAM enzyme
MLTALIRAHLRTLAGRAPRPFAAHWYLTFRPRGPGDPARHPELETAALLRVVGQLRGLRVVKLLGGEPFLRPDLPVFLRAVRDVIGPEVCQLNTFGHPDVPRVVDEVAWPRLHLRVASEGELDLDLLRELAALRARRGFGLGVNFHLTDETLPRLDEVQRRCDELGVGFFPGLPVKPVLFRYRPEDLPPPPLSDLDVLLDVLGDKRGSGYSRLQAAALRRRDAALVRQVQREGRARFDCKELASLIYLLPDGAVVPCGLRPRPVGNLAQQTLEAVWSSPEAQAARREVRDCPGCWQTSVALLSGVLPGVSYR